MQRWRSSCSRLAASCPVNIGGGPAPEPEPALIGRHDLPALWHNPATSMKDRKRLIRLLVTDVTLLKDGDTITTHVRLPGVTTPGGQDRTLTVPRPLTAWEAHTTPEATVALISSLLDEHPFDQIASILNQRGITGGWGRPYTAHSLAAVCRARGIPGHSERLRAAGYLTDTETLRCSPWPTRSPAALSTRSWPSPTLELGIEALRRDGPI